MNFKCEIRCNSNIDHQRSLAALSFQCVSNEPFLLVSCVLSNRDCWCAHSRRIELLPVQQIDETNCNSETTKNETNVQTLEDFLIAMDYNHIDVILQKVRVSLFLSLFEMALKRHEIHFFSDFDDGCSCGNVICTQNQRKRK